MKKTLNTLALLWLAMAFSAFMVSACGDTSNDPDGDVTDGDTADGDEDVEETVDTNDDVTDGDVEEAVVDGDADTTGDILTDVPVQDGYPAGPFGYNVGDVMKDFTLKDCDGNDIQLKNYFTNAKAVFINQSAGWCSVCRSEVTRMEAMYQNFKDDGLVILQPMYQNNTGGAADAAFCQSWRDQYSLTYPVLVDDKNYFGPYHPNFATGEMATPLNMILDENMRIVYVVEGLIPQSLEGIICTQLGRDDCFE